jgi:predicted metal-binding protein
VRAVFIKTINQVDWEKIVNSLIYLKKHVICVVGGAIIHLFAHHIKRKKSSKGAIKIFVSSCFLGENCKYDGGNNYSDKVAEFIKGNR